MHVVLTHHVGQSTRDGGARSLIDLLVFVEFEWQKHLASSRRTMNELKVPPNIEYLFLGGKRYRIGGPRKIWFKKVEKAARGYNPDLFYVTEAFDDDGHPHQLDFDLSKGSVFDDELIVKARPVDITRFTHASVSTGPLVRE